MANVDYAATDDYDPRNDCKVGAGVPSMAAYAQMRQEPQQNAQAAQDYLNQQINRQVIQSQEEMLLRQKQAQQREAEREHEYVASLLLPPRAKVQGVANKCVIKAPEPKKKGNAALELMDAMEYLIADIKGNVIRNKALRGIDTNFAIRRAQDALIEARRTYRGPLE